MNFGDGFSLVLLDLIRKVARNDASKRTKFLRIVFALLAAPSSSVSFEAAGTLVTLSAAPSAIRAAAAAYIKILNKESDNSVKLIVLDRLSALRAKHTKSVRDLVMDILRALSCPNNDIRKRTLDVAMELVYPRNVDEVMALLKKEIISTSGASSVPERGMSHRTSLSCAPPSARVASCYPCACGFTRWVQTPWPLSTAVCSSLPSTGVRCASPMWPAMSFTCSWTS